MMYKESVLIINTCSVTLIISVLSFLFVSIATFFPKVALKCFVSPLSLFPLLQLGSVIVIKYVVFVLV